MNPIPTPTRRTFVKTVGGAAALTLIGGRRSRAANATGRLQHACIGVGGMGGHDMGNIASHPNVDIVALCDVDMSILESAGQSFPSARRYQDWRELLEKEADKIDSVNVTVPDHMHAAIAMAAIRAGKHVYCQKPMCHDVAEVRALTLAAAKAGVVTQLGTQHASGIGDRMGVQMLREGAIGKVKRLILCSNRPNAIETYRLPGPRPATYHNPPEHLNWDLWLGTAPVRPFAPTIYHTMIWRSWQDFGTGWSGDIGCHIFDAPWRALGLTAPLSVIARVQDSWRDTPARRGDTWPQSQHITWIFPGNEMTAHSTLQVEWFDGLFYPREDDQALCDVPNYPAESMLAIGEEGVMLLPHGSGPQFFPREKFRGIERPKLEARDHYHTFVDACLGKATAESHFGISGPMTEAILLGTVAIRVPDTRLDWDFEAMKVTNIPDANRFIRREYREGWRVEGL